MNIMKYILEQTTCPYCENDIGNIVLKNDEDVFHRLCGKCSKHYIVNLPKQLAADVDNAFCKCVDPHFDIVESCSVCGKPPRY